MKKFICLLTIFVICVSLVACAGQAPSKDNSSGKDNTTANQDQSSQNKDESEGEIEIKIDYVAEKLGLTGESEVLYGLIGAIAGKQYNGGDVELYQFDENSDAYKDLIARKTYLIPAAYKNGVVLIFALGVEPDQNLVDAFNALDF